MVIYVTREEFDKFQKYTETAGGIIDEISKSYSSQQVQALLKMGYRESVERTFGTFEGVAERIQKGKYAPVSPLTVDQLRRLSERMLFIVAKGRKLFNLPKTPTMLN